MPTLGGNNIAFRLSGIHFSRRSILDASFHVRNVSCSYDMTSYYVSMCLARFDAGNDDARTRNAVTARIRHAQSNQAAISVAVMLMHDLAFLVVKRQASWTAPISATLPVREGVRCGCCLSWMGACDDGHHPQTPLPTLQSCPS